MAAILCALDPSGAGRLTGRAFCSRLHSAATVANQLPSPQSETGLPPMKDHFETQDQLPAWSAGLQKDDSAFQAHVCKVAGAVQSLNSCAALRAAQHLCRCRYCCR